METEHTSHQIFLRQHMHINDRTNMKTMTIKPAMHNVTQMFVDTVSVKHFIETLSVIGVGSPVHSSSVSGRRRRSKASTVDRLIGRSRRHRT